MFAVIKTGGKQYRVQKGDVLVVEKLDLEKGEKVNFDQVLLVDDEDKTLIGTPFIKNALVKGEVIENFKDKKVIIFKKKRRKQYRRKKGHRQELTRIRIEEIVSELKAARKKEATPKEIKKEEPKKPEKAKTGEKAKAAKTAEPQAKATAKKRATAKAAPKAKKSKRMKEREHGS